eukprot:TRINITY_DN72364_c0_g1_i1.p1 TRINITY_DN72364_c0_g1~~TRINITY_DN72364_c0_g1_i1.p1  ORF type:complete len:244 (+),score=56.82 TRINITY_DN72364_c0_g1_i1:85-732(+)
MAKGDHRGTKHAGSKENNDKLKDPNVAVDKFRSLIKKKFKNPGDAFKGLDRDDDKGVTVDEFMAALLSISKEWDEADKSFAMTEGRVVFDELDISKDGTLTYKEFKERLLHRMGGEDEKKRHSSSMDPIAKLRSSLKGNFKDPKDAFSALDKDGDTSLCRDEFKVMLSSCAETCKWNNDVKAFMDENVDAIFDAMDYNADGNVTLKEFKRRLSGK